MGSPTTSLQSQLAERDAELERLRLKVFAHKGAITMRKCEIAAQNNEIATAPALLGAQKSRIAALIAGEAAATSARVEAVKL